MTAACGGGTSSVKPTAQAIIAYGSGLVADLLVLVESPWLIPVIPLLSLPPIASASFCTSDPPAQPTFTAAEATALLGFEVGTPDWNSGALKVQHLIENALWHQICQCDSGNTPPAAIAPAPPSTVAIPVYQNSPGIQPCNVFVYTTTTAVGGTQNLGGPLYQSGLTPTFFVAKVVNTTVSGAGQTARVDFVQQGGGNPTLQTNSVTVGPNQTQTIQFPANPAVQGILFEWNSLSGSGTTHITNSEIDAYCSGTGLPTQSVTCPPDPTTLALLEQILQLVTLVQRQHVPFAYIPGTVHGPLGISGEFDLDAIVLGLKIEVSGIDGTVGEQALDPTRLFDVGYVAIGDADGFWCQQRVTNPSQLYFPKFAGSATKVGWTSTSNARLTITELLREH